MKKLLVLLLLMVSTNIFAEWTRVTESADGDMTAYIDFGTIKRKGNKVKMWHLQDYKAVFKQKWRISYLSGASYYEYDCEEETIKMLDLYLYSGNMGHGESVGSRTKIKDEAKSVIPGSITETLFKAACSKK